MALLATCIVNGRVFITITAMSHSLPHISYGPDAVLETVYIVARGIGSETCERVDTPIYISN